MGICSFLHLQVTRSCNSILLHKAGPKLRDLPALATQVLRLRALANMPSYPTHYDLQYNLDMQLNVNLQT